MNKITGFACALILSSPCLALAQVGTTTVTTTTETPDPNTTIRASQILGSTVHLQGTNNYGKVDDIIMSNGGGPSYLVVSNAGRFAMMPFGAANFDVAQRAVTYNVTSQAIQPLLFEHNAYPNIADEQFNTRTKQVFTGGGEKMKIKTKPNGTIKEKIKNP